MCGEQRWLTQNHDSLKMVCVRKKLHLSFNDNHFMTKLYSIVGQGLDYTEKGVYEIYDKFFEIWLKRQ